MMLHWLSFCFLFHCLAAVDIDPALQLNQLRFPWGVNYKFNGLLHHNLARVWVVTKFKIPPRNRFHFPTVKLKPDCSFYARGNSFTTSRVAGPRSNRSAVFSDHYKYDLRQLCEDSLPLFSLIESREEYHKNKLIELVEQDLYGTLQSYRSTGQRSQRFASLVISAVTGLVTLAVEGISRYLQNKRNKAMANAMDALHKAQADQYNTLRRYKDDLLLYGTYNLNSTLGVLDTLEGMQLNQASLSDTISNLPSGEWPLFYLTKTGLYRYVSHLSLHALTLHHKVDFLYETLIKEIQTLVKGIATLSKGYLPPELFPPSFLRNITERVARELTNDHKGYKLAFDHENAYYDMQLATFSLDQWFDLIVTFPIFIVPLRHKPLNLYEIETVPVPIDDTDPTAKKLF